MHYPDYQGSSHGRCTQANLPNHPLRPPIGGADATKGGDNFLYPSLSLSNLAVSLLLGLGGAQRAWGHDPTERELGLHLFPK
jgi:hypothetical protein